LKRSFKPLTNDFYVADWYLDEDENTLHSKWSGSQDIRVRLKVHLEYIDSKWQDTNGVSRETDWRK